jgi:hypothetical protein
LDVGRTGAHQCRRQKRCVGIAAIERPDGSLCLDSFPAGRIVGEAGVGLVSRVTPVHTAVRNCTRDEGRSFGFGNQVLIPSHRKLLRSKAMVVNVAEKSEEDFDRYD